MKFNVKIFVDGKEVKSSDLSNYQLYNVAIDKIVNSVIDRIQPAEVQKKAS